jgi:hypothetical protein
MPLQTDAKPLCSCKLAINKISAGRKFSLLFYAEDNEATAAIAINNLASQSLHPTSANKRMHYMTFGVSSNPSKSTLMLAEKV